MSTWRDNITIHPLADTFPMMSDGELKELAEDIKKNGQLTPIQFAHVAGQKVLIDGRNRLAACFLIGKRPEEVIIADSEIFKDEATIEAFIISQNVFRRHLTPEQRAAVLQAVIKATPDISDRELGRAAHVSHKTIGRVRKKMEATGTLVPSSKRTGLDGRTRKLPVKKAAKDEAQDVCNTLAADLGAAINGFAVGPPEVSIDERKAQHAALDDAPAEQSADVGQVTHTLTIPPHAEPADLARRIIDAFGDEKAAVIAGEILRVTAPPEKEEAPKRARGRPPGSKNKAKDADRQARNQ